MIFLLLVLSVQVILEELSVTRWTVASKLFCLLSFCKLLSLLLSLACRQDAAICEGER